MTSFLKGKHLHDNAMLISEVESLVLDQLADFYKQGLRSYLYS